MIRVTFGILLLILLAHNYHYDSFIDIIVCNTALFIMLMKWRLKFWAHHKMDPSNSAYTRKVSVVSTMPFDARNLKNNSNRIPFEQLTVRERSSHRNNISSNIYNRSKSHAIVKKKRWILSYSAIGDHDVFSRNAQMRKKGNKSVKLNANKTSDISVWKTGAHIPVCMVRFGLVRFAIRLAFVLPRTFQIIKYSINVAVWIA